METISGDFKKYFLLTFTKELIKHSSKQDIRKLQNIIGIEESKRREKTSPTFEVKTISLQKNASSPSQIPQRQFAVKPMLRQIKRQSLFIAEPKLPAHLEYLKPIPEGNAGVDLFKINPLINDPAVRVIEGNSDENVIVGGAMGTKPTSIHLSKEDVDRIINKFSESSKIPANEGIYRVVLGNLILSAIISNVIGSRFVIKKMIAPREQSFQNK